MAAGAVAPAGCAARAQRAQRGRHPRRAERGGRPHRLHLCRAHQPAGCGQDAAADSRRCRLRCSRCCGSGSDGGSAGRACDGSGRRRRWQQPQHRRRSACGASRRGSAGTAARAAHVAGRCGAAGGSGGRGRLLPRRGAAHGQQRDLGHRCDEGHTKGGQMGGWGAGRCHTQASCAPCQPEGCTRMPSVADRAPPWPRQLIPEPHPTPTPPAAQCCSDGDEL